MTALAFALLALQLQGMPNQLTPQELDQLLHVVAQGDRPQVEQVINRLQFLGTPKPATHALVKMAEGEIPGSPENAVYVLSVLHPPEAGPAFVQLLGSDSGPTRIESCRGLQKLKPSSSAAKALGAALQDSVAGVRRECAKTLAAWDGGKQGPALIKALGHEQDPDAKLAEIEALGHVKSAASVKALEPLLATKGAEHLAVARALAAQGAPSGKKALEDASGDVDPGVRAEAVSLLASIDAPWSSEALAKRLDDPSAQVCIAAAKALNARRDARGVTALILRAERASPDDKFAFEGALSELRVTQAQRLDVIQKNGGAN